MHQTINAAICGGTSDKSVVIIEVITISVGADIGEVHEACHGARPCTVCARQTVNEHIIAAQKCRVDCFKEGSKEVTNTLRRLFVELWFACMRLLKSL
jgi:hypothetical protein